MKGRPINLRGWEVRAWLDGRLSQIRRPVKPQPNRYWLDERERAEMVCPLGAPGDVLWGRETFSGPHCIGDASPSKWGRSSRIWYWADGNPSGGDWTRPRPSIHMPRWASRITLEITGVRVERLMAISRGDAMEEGCPFANMATADPCGWYAELWDEINGRGAWAANPFVWVVEFRRAGGGEHADR